MNTDTPRTDEAAFTDDRSNEVVNADFACQLERELTIAKKIAAVLFDIVEKLSPGHEIVPLFKSGKEYVHQSELAAAQAEAAKWREMAERLAQPKLKSRKSRKQSEASRSPEKSPVA